MIIRVKKRDTPYAIIDKRPLDDIGLSWKAKGLLAYLLSKPDNWRPIIEELAKASKDSIDSVRSGLKELERAGYLVRKMIRDNRGKIAGWEHIVYESPQLGFPQLGNPILDNPQLDFPQLDSPHVGNPRLISKEVISNELIINEFNNNVAPNGADTIAPVEIAKAGAQCDEGNKPGSSGKGEEYSANFLEFWSAYPRKKEKSKAWRVWRTRIKEKTPASNMIIAAKNYAVECLGFDEKYIKLAATFIGPDKPFLEYENKKPVESPGGIVWPPAKNTPLPDPDCPKCHGTGKIKLITDDEFKIEIDQTCDCVKRKEV